MRATTVDPFDSVQEATRRHRAEHGCGAYTFEDGPLLGLLAGVSRASRIVEVGTALGYTSLWLAHGAQTAHVDTIEADSSHVRLAREQIARAGLDERIDVHDGRAEEILPRLEPASYDLAFFDGYRPTREVVDDLDRLLRPGATLVVANLRLGVDGDLLDDLAEGPRWLSRRLGEIAVCVKRL
jgi:predicted O-methyltransferase YrrM